MKRILLYIFLSITIFSEPILLKNESQLTNNSQKISAIEYEKLKWKFEQLEKEIRELKENSINNKEILSDVTQKYVDVSLYLKESTGDVKSLYRESFDDLKTLIYQFLALVIAVLIGIKVIGTWELNKKFEDLEKIKDDLQKLEDDIKKKYLFLDKKTANELNKIKEDVSYKLKDINDLSNEIKTTLNVQKENIITKIKGSIVKDDDEKFVMESINRQDEEKFDLNIGEELVDNEKYEEAILNYEKVLKAAKENIVKYQAYCELARVYFILNRYEESLINFKNALKFNSILEKDESINLYEKLGYVYYKLERYDESLECFIKSYDLNPLTKNSNLFKFLGRIYDKKNDKEKTIEMFEKVLEIEQEDSKKFETKEILAEIYDKYKEYEKAIDLYKELLNEAKKRYMNRVDDFKYRIGVIYYSMKKYVEALKVFSSLEEEKWCELSEIYIKLIKDVHLKKN